MQRRGPAIDDSRPIWRTMGVFLVPLMLSNVLQSISQTLNSIFLGRMIGVQALAAASSFFPIVFFMVSFFIGISSASSVLIGQAYGARNEERLKAVAGTTLALSIISGIVVGALGVAFLPQLLHLLGTPADIFDNALAYARVTFTALPLFFVYLAYTTFVRGTGDSRTPFLALIVSAAVACVACPALIQGWLGLPKLGVSAAAVANIIANAVGLVYVLVSLRIEKNPLALDVSILRHMKLEGGLVTMLLKIGIPTGVQMVMVSLAEIAVIALVNRFGSGATAAYGAVNQIASYVQFPAISIGITASIFGAQSIGAQRFDRLRKVARAGIGLNWAITGALIVIVYVFNDRVLGWFITDAAVLRTAHDLLTITLWSYAIFGTTAVLSGLMRSSGAVLWPTLLGIVSIWGVEVPVAYALAPHYGLTGVWIAYPVAFIANLLMQTVYYHGFWKRSRMQALIEGPAPAAV
ncbi:MAG TPA: MATE family efflux transporter [Candidatus Elarobacter sp.]